MPTEGTKVCNTCKVEKHVSEYYANPVKKDGLQQRCKDCLNKANRVVSQLKKTAPPQPEVCDCCKQPATKYMLDHDHETGEFRGWLCRSCNTGIGALGDNLSGLMNAVNYINETTNRR